MQNYTDTILAQYANSPTLDGLIDTFNQNIDPSINLDAFYTMYWDLKTAQGYGLDVWGKIVNISRNVKITLPTSNFGFKEGKGQEFGFGSFYTGVPVTSIYALSDDAYRTLIFIKALANITNCTAPSLNALLKFLFKDRGRCYVQDTGDMTLRFVFEFQLTAVELGIMVNSGAIPRPAGVLASVMTFSRSGTFGFSEGNGRTFGYGSFFSTNNFQTITG
jgi:hypothetical protein